MTNHWIWGDFQTHMCHNHRGAWPNQVCHSYAYLPTGEPDWSVPGNQSLGATTMDPKKTTLRSTMQQGDDWCIFRERKHILKHLETS